MFGGLSNGAITTILLILSLLMALLLIFFALEVAKGKADELDEQDSQDKETEVKSQEQEIRLNDERIEVLPVYTIPSYEIVDEVSQNVEVSQVLEVSQESVQHEIVSQEIIQQETTQQETKQQEITQQVIVSQEIIQQETEQQAVVIEIPPVEEQESTTSETLKRGIETVLPDEDETGEMGVRYDRSFTAKLIQSSDEVKEWYTDIKNHLLSYKKVRERMSWGRESFRIGKDCFARLVIKGKTLCVMLAIIPESCNDTKYKIEDIADLPSCKETPCLYRIKSNRRVTYAKELIDIILEGYDAALNKNRQDVDYYMPYEGTLDLIKRGLIKRKIVAKNKDFLTHINSDGDGGVDVA